MTEPRIRIGVVGEYVAERDTHHSVATAVHHAADALGVDATVMWHDTSALHGAAAALLGGCDAVWIAPGAPYASLAGALDAITFARESDVPLLGTCAGFQHIVLEFARGVVGFADAQHAEYDPHAEHAVVDLLACSLVGQAMPITIAAGTIAHAAYGSCSAVERYYCNYGLNASYTDQLRGAGLVISATDDEGEARIVELPELRFYVGTLFVPQTSSTPERPHPLIGAYLAAAARRTGVGAA
ncbi:MAG TPA: hypothetical protein VGQ20_03440 [Acidimicrobiales bacterium]|nr:hypothetical protein [Acidimicrobiales bacterium]